MVPLKVKGNTRRIREVPMSFGRRDDWLSDAQGNALAGAQVYICNQPADTTTVPPSPLASVYSDSGGTPASNPQITNGFGQATEYLDATQLFTLVFVHPLFGPNPVILVDQAVQSAANASTSSSPVQASTTAGTITGTIPGSTFNLPSVPVQSPSKYASLLLQRNGQVLTPGLTYTIADNSTTITLSTPLQTGENLNANYLTSV